MWTATRLGVRLAGGINMNIKKEPITSRLHIKNKTRFVLFSTLIIITILAAFMPVQKEQQIEYKPYVVSYGDTYWQLARKAQNDGYKADIRIIIDRMVERSGIKAHELKEGDTIFIPEVINHE